MPLRRFDIVCRIVDNYGDAGFCWRLARQLVAEHGLAVRLWIDDLVTLGHMAPVDPKGPDLQRAADVDVCRLRESVIPNPLPDVLVAGFGCPLPAAWLAAMAAAPVAPVYINLEYLSAESWVDGMHGLPSPHPQLPLMRWVFFPGFTTESGGLIRERNLLSARAAFEADPSAANALWDSLGLRPRLPGEVAVWLFCYPNAALPALFDTWSSDPAPVRVVVPATVAHAALEQWTAGRVPPPGQSVTNGAMTLAVVPFTDQDGFDRRLWACDLDIVRGEDSFVRGQWAGRPLVWHAYPQAQRGHAVKLDAFLVRYLHDVPAADAAALASFTHAFNDEDAQETTRSWSALRCALPGLRRHAERWARRLAQQSDLASRLVEFARFRL